MVPLILLESEMCSEVQAELREDPRVPIQRTLGNFLDAYSTEA